MPLKAVTTLQRVNLIYHSSKVLPSKRVLDRKKKKTDFKIQCLRRREAGKDRTSID